jgi:hypothetical protein
MLNHPLNLRAFAIVVVAAVSACAGAAAAPSPTPGPVATTRATPTAVPGDPGGTGGSGGSDPGTGVGGGIIVPDPGDPNQDPLFGEATYVKPVQGLVNLRTVSVGLVRAIVNADGTATADLRWWSGVAPCSALDHVEIVQDDAAKTIQLKVIEGSAAGDVACIDIAQLTATAVDLGKLASGSWTISAEGDAKPIPLDVP